VVRVRGRLLMRFCRRTSAAATAGMPAILLDDQRIAAQPGMATTKPGHAQRLDRLTPRRRAASLGELPVLVILREQSVFDKLSLVRVGREGKGAELVGHGIVAGRGFTFLRVKEQQLLEIRMPHRLADRVQQGQQQPLAFK
jgi:hypothetical protein